MNMMTFVTLWKLKRPGDAAQYLESAAEKLNKVLQGLETSKMSQNCSQNLYGLIIMSLAGLKICLENKVEEALEMCEEYKAQLEGDSLIYRLISGLAEGVQGGKGAAEDWLIGEKYQTLLFVSTFMPLISANTPLIRLSELEDAKSKISYGEEAKSNVSFRVVASKERLDSSKMSRNGLKSNSRPSYAIKPWWESNKMIDRPIRSTKNHVARSDRQFRSEPRAYKDTSLCPEFKSIVTPGLAPQKTGKPLSKEAFYNEIIRDKEQHEAYGDDKDLYMFELGSGNENIDCQIQLVPISMFNTRRQNEKKQEKPMKLFKPYFLT